MSRLSAGLANEAATLAERVVTLGTGTTTLDPAKHANRTLIVPAGAVPITINLPHATGSGDVYKFLLNAAQTSGSIIINAPATPSSNKFVGRVVQRTSASLVVVFASTTNDIFTINGTTQGGVTAGDYVVFQDTATAQWLVLESSFTTSGAQATPFSG